MSKGWKGEVERHSLSAKGIKGKSNKKRTDAVETNFIDVNCKFDNIIKNERYPLQVMNHTHKKLFQKSDSNLVVAIERLRKNNLGYMLAYDMVRGFDKFDSDNILTLVNNENWESFNNKECGVFHFVDISIDNRDGGYSAIKMHNKIISYLRRQMRVKENSIFMFNISNINDVYESLKPLIDVTIKLNKEGNKQFSSDYSWDLNYEGMSFLQKGTYAPRGLQSINYGREIEDKIKNMIDERFDDLKERSL